MKKHFVLALITTFLLVGCSSSPSNSEPFSTSLPPSLSPSTSIIPPLTTAIPPPPTTSAKPPVPSSQDDLMVSPLAGSYYSSINLNIADKRKLKTSLGSLIKSTHRSVSYGDLWTAYKETDLKPGTNYIWDIYSDVNFKYASKQCGNYSVEGDCYNREHSVPKSWFGDATPMYSDIFHLYPTDGKVNGMRSNYAYGNVATATYTSKNGSKLGNAKTSFGYNGKVFEPIDEYKGDLARTYFYFVTRYEGVNMISGDGNVHFTPTASATFGLSQYSINLLLEWAEKDPISEKEINRNQAIFLKVQKNRNPFIDIPNLADYIWGSLRK